MKIRISHNLDQKQLQKAILGLATSGGVEAEVIEALQKATGRSCDEPRDPRDPATRDLFHQMRGEFTTALNDIKRSISRILEAPQVEKAQGPAKPLSKEQIRDIQQVIKDRFEFIAAQMQDDFVPPADVLARWQAEGWIEPDVTPETFAMTVHAQDRYIHNAYVFGRMYQAVEAGGTFADIMRRAVALPLLAPDKYAIAVAEQHAANYITALGDDLAKTAGGIIAKKNREKIRDMVADYHSNKMRAKVIDEDEKRDLGMEIPERTVDTWKGLSSELYHAMADKSRDWDRVAYYEIHDAKAQGQAMEIANELGPKKLVYKMPLPTACPQCKHLYLDDDGTPRLFQVDQMAGWGNNVGRKPHPIKGGKVVPGGRGDGAETLMPVTGQVHPWCQCLGPYPFTGREPWAKQKRQVPRPMQKSKGWDMTVEDIVDGFHKELKAALGQGDFDQQKTICIDFDGVIADYSKGFQGKDKFGPPLPWAAEAITQLRWAGWRIILHTTRQNTPALRRYLQENGIQVDAINENPDQPADTNHGKPIADVYLDDRAIRFNNWKQALGEVLALQKSSGTIRIRRARRIVVPAPGLLVQTKRR